MLKTVAIALALSTATPVDTAKKDQSVLAEGKSKPVATTQIWKSRGGTRY